MKIALPLAVAAHGIVIAVVAFVPRPPRPAAHPTRIVRVQLVSEHHPSP